MVINNVNWDSTYYSTYVWSKYRSIAENPFSFFKKVNRTFWFKCHHVHLSLGHMFSFLITRWHLCSRLSTLNYHTGNWISTSFTHSLTPVTTCVISQRSSHSLFSLLIKLTVYILHKKFCSSIHIFTRNRYEPYHFLRLSLIIILLTIVKIWFSLHTPTLWTDTKMLYCLTDAS